MPSRESASLRVQRVRLGVGILLFAFAVVLPLFRQVGVPSWQTIWAEDGTVCFQEAHRDGALAVLLRPIAGYLQLPPRLLGALSTLVPLLHLPLYFALASTTVAALLAWFLYAVSASWIGSRVIRLALAAQIVLMPAVGRENTATIINVIWAFAAAAPWALISLEERRGHVVARSAVAFLAATSTALSVIYVPLALGWGWLRRTRAAWIVVGAFFAGLLLQMAVLAGVREGGRLPKPAGVSVSTLADLMSVRVFGMTLIGTTGIDALWADHGRTLVIAAPLVFALILACLYPHAGRRQQLLAAMFVGYAIVSFAFPIWGRGMPWIRFVPIVEGAPYNFGRLRFSVIPSLMLVSAIAVLIAPTAAGGTRTIARIARPLFVAQLIVLMVAGFSIYNPRSSGPSWSSSVLESYLTECLGASPGKVVEVKTQFLGYYPVTLSCEELREAVAPDTRGSRDPSSTEPATGQLEKRAQHDSNMRPSGS